MLYHSSGVKAMGELLGCSWLMQHGCPSPCSSPQGRGDGFSKLSREFATVQITNNHHQRKRSFLTSPVGEVGALATGEGLGCWLFTITRSPYCRRRQRIERWG